MPMKLEILMSCMHQSDDALVRASGITGDVVMVNQCAREGYAEFPTEHGTARMVFSSQRGLTRSRNLAIRHSDADICMLCDDDEQFAADYETKILTAYEDLPQADVIIFRVQGLRSSLGEEITRLRFPKTMKVCSVQISFRRQRLLDKGVAFDELLGSGTGNGAEEELKFLCDCEKAGLKIYYVPAVVASVAMDQSVWFDGFSETFFENRGATTRYILGIPLASLYALYYIAAKRSLYRNSITPRRALRAIFRGIRENKIGKQARKAGELEYSK